MKSESRSSTIEKEGKRQSGRCSLISYPPGRRSEILSDSARVNIFFRRHWHDLGTGILRSAWGMTLKSFEFPQHEGHRLQLVIVQYKALVQ